MFKLLTDTRPDENNLVSLSLDEIARLGAKKLLSEALQLEVSEYIERCKHNVDDDGHRQVVRHGSHK